MTRHNLCPNPAAGTNATGWSGTALPARDPAVTGMLVTTGIESTGSGFIQTPTGVVTPGQDVTVSFQIKNNSGGTIAGGKQVFVAFTRSAGGDDFTQSFNTAALGINGNVQRASGTVVAPALATGVYLVIDGLPADIQVTAVLYETVAALDTYFDGDSPSCTWDGAADNSTSTFNDTSEISSDLDVRWRVRNLVSSDADLRWRVRNTVTSDLDLRWRVRNIVTSDLTIKFRVGDIPEEEGVASYDLNEILDALAAIFQDMSTGLEFGGVEEKLTAYADVTSEPTTPAIVLEVDDIVWDESMGGGADTFIVLATILVQAADTVGAQRAMRSFLSRKPTSGMFRIKTALEADRTLGGLVSYAHLARVRDIGQITYNDIRYLGADLVIEVMSA